MSNYYFYVLQGLDFHNNVKIMAFQCADTVTSFIHTLILIHGTDTRPLSYLALKK